MFGTEARHRVHSRFARVKPLLAADDSRMKFGRDTEPNEPSALLRDVRVLDFSHAFQGPVPQMKKLDIRGVTWCRSS